MGTKRLGVAVAVLDGYLYAIGGSDGQCPLNTGIFLKLSEMDRSQSILKRIKQLIDTVGYFLTFLNICLHKI